MHSHAAHNPLSLFEKHPLGPISASDQNFNPQNTQLSHYGIDCALQRFNEDTRAGYGSLVPPGYTGDLFGAAKIGYDLNRYHYALLDGPIYPVETQAMIYAVKMFEPEFVLDLHNQNIKSRCSYTSEEEYAKCTDGSAGEWIDGTVQSDSITIAPIYQYVQTRSERMGAHLLAALNANNGNFDLFIMSDQFSDILLDLGILTEPISDDDRITISPIERP